MYERKGTVFPTITKKEIKKGIVQKAMNNQNLCTILRNSHLALFNTFFFSMKIWEEMFQEYTNGTKKKRKMLVQYMLFFCYALIQGWGPDLSTMAKKMEEEALQGRLQHITNGIRLPCSPQHLGKMMERLAPIIQAIILKLGSVGQELQRHYTMKMNSHEKPLLSFPTAVDGSVYMKGEKQWKEGINYGQERKGVKTVIMCSGTLPSVIKQFYFSTNAADQAEIETIQQHFSATRLTTGDKAFLSRDLMEYADVHNTFYLIRISQSYTQKILATCVHETSYGPVQEATIQIGETQDPNTHWIVRKLTYFKREKNTVQQYEWVTNRWDITVEELREGAERHWIIEQVHQQIQETFALHKTKLRKEERVKGFIALGHMLGQLYTIFFLRTQKKGEPFVFTTAHETIKRLWKKRVEARTYTYKTSYTKKSKETHSLVQQKVKKKHAQDHKRALHALKTGRISSRGQDRVHPDQRKPYDHTLSDYFSAVPHSPYLQKNEQVEHLLRQKGDTTGLRVWFLFCYLYPKQMTRQELCTLLLLPRTTLFDALKRLEQQQIIDKSFMSSLPSKKQSSSPYLRRGRPYTVYSLRKPPKPPPPPPH